MSSDILNEDAVLEVLGTVQDPDLNRDIVSLGFIKDLVIDGGFCGVMETTVISMADGDGPEVIREGAGPVDSIY